MPPGLDLALPPSLVERPSGAAARTGTPPYRRAVPAATAARYSAIVRARPESRSIFGLQPSERMRDVSQSLRGVPSGLVASHAISAGHPVAALIFSARPRIVISTPEPTLTVPHQEEALSRGKSRGTPESCPHSQSPPDVSVHSRETCFPCTASSFKPRIDSHDGGTWDSPVGKPR